MPEARHVECTHETLIVELTDGRVLAVPLAWYPRLANAKAAERDNWELIGEGDGIHPRPDLVVVVECKHEVGPACPRESPV